MRNIACINKNKYLTRVFFKFIIFFNKNKKSYIWILTEIMDTSLDTIYPKCTMSEQLISKIAHAVLNGLEFMNNKEILHRDIKPSNILLNINGKIKLCDFGISGFTKNSVCTSYRGCESYMSVSF